MKVLIIERHDGEGAFPTFPKGTVVENVKPCAESAHWLSCSINGLETYIPDLFLEGGVLLRDYDPTELVAEKGDYAEVRAIVYEWLYAINSRGAGGWIPAGKTVSARFVQP